MDNRLPAVLVIALVPVMVSCGGSGAPRATPTPCVSPSAVSSELLPSRLGLESFGVVTKVERRGGYTGAEFITEESVIELYPRMVRELGERGYTFVGGDNEGFEAELAFLDRKERNISFSVRRGCGEQNLVRVLIQEDPSV